MGFKTVFLKVIDFPVSVDHKYVCDDPATYVVAKNIIVH